MLAWLAENAATILISAALIALVALLIRAVVKGRVGCSGDCAGCAGHGAAPAKTGSPCGTCQFHDRCRGG